MKPNIKNKVPLAFLILISIFWGYYYSSSNALNDFGNANHEWLFMLDAFLILPILCFLCESNKKQVFLKATILCCTAVLIGSFIIPEQNKEIFPFLESGRYLVLAIVLISEITALLTVYLAIRSSLVKGEDPDFAISNSINGIFGESFFASLLNFEVRMWTFALISSQIQSTAYDGDRHFFYDKKDGAHSNLLGFIALILIEVPLVHIVLHFAGSSTAANITTVLTLFGLIFFFAEYKAVAKRPISISGDKLIVRYGLYNPYIIPLNNISDIRLNDEFVKRQQGIKRFNYSGIPNLAITLCSPIDGKEFIFLGVNSPDDLMNAIKHAKCS